MNIIQKILKWGYNFLESLASSALIGFAVRMAFHSICNTFLSAVFLPNINTLSHMMVYLLYISTVLPTCSTKKPATKIKLLSTVKRLGSKLINLNQKANAFLNSAFTGTVAVFIMLYIKFNLLLAAPTLALFSLLYLVISATLSEEAADTIFDPRVIVISLLCGYGSAMLSGISLIAFHCIYTLSIIAAYIHFYEDGNGKASNRYSKNSLMMLALTLFDPLFYAAQHVTALGAICLTLNSAPAVFARFFLTLTTCGTTIQNALESREISAGATHGKIYKPKASGPSADPLPTPAAA